MNKRISLLVIILAIFAIVGSISAQKVKIELSPEFKLSKQKSLASHLHSDQTGHYMYFRERVVKGILVTQNVNFVIEKYDKEFKQIFSKTYLSDKKNINALEMKYFKGKFAWLQYEKDRKNDDLNYHFQLPRCVR